MENMTQEFRSKISRQMHDWIIEKRMQQEAKLKIQEEFVAQHPHFEEAKDVLVQLQGDVKTCEKMFEFLQKAEPKTSVSTKNQKSSEKKLTVLKSEFHSTDREPVDMLKPEFKGMRMVDIIESILNAEQVELSTEQIAKIAYNTNSDADFERAKASLSAQLRIGVSKGKWLKTSRGVFAANILQNLPQEA